MTDKLPVFISEAQIAKRVKELGTAISRDLKGKQIVCVGVLKGSIVFFSDLIRNIDLPLEIDFLGASSYGSKTISSGVVKITLDLSLPIEGKDVVLVEDIIDTGLTIDYIMENLKTRNPASIRLCSLLVKPSKLHRPIPIDYLGFTIDDRFVIGYGLDAAEKYRNLPYLAYLEGNHE
jgi:hypoxanthine phosphoribosyltransferase